MGPKGIVLPYVQVAAKKRRADDLNAADAYAAEQHCMRIMALVDVSVCAEHQEPSWGATPDMLPCSPQPCTGMQT